MRVEKEKKGKAKLVLCKTSAPVPAGYKLFVNSQEIIDLGDGDSETIEHRVGRLVVEEVKSERLIYCKVTRGGDRIKKQLSDEIRFAL